MPSAHSYVVTTPPVIYSKLICPIGSQPRHSLDFMSSLQASALPLRLLLAAVLFLGLRHTPVSGGAMINAAASIGVAVQMPSWGWNSPLSGSPSFPRRLEIRSGGNTHLRLIPTMTQLHVGHGSWRAISSPMHYAVLVSATTYNSGRQAVTSFAICQLYS